MTHYAVLSGMFMACVEAGDTMHAAENFMKLWHDWHLDHPGSSKHIGTIIAIVQSGHHIFEEKETSYVMTDFAAAEAKIPITSPSNGEILPEGISRPDPVSDGPDQQESGQPHSPPASET